MSAQVRPAGERLMTAEGAFEAYRDLIAGIPPTQLARGLHTSSENLTRQLRDLGFLNKDGDPVMILPEFQNLLLGKLEEANSDSEQQSVQIEKDHSLITMYQIHGMSRRLMRSCQGQGWVFLEDSVEPGPSRLLSAGFTSEQIKELFRFQLVFLYQEQPAALERLKTIRELKHGAVRLSQKIERLRQGEEEKQLYEYLGRMNKALANMEKHNQEGEPEKIIGGIRSRLTGEKIMALMHMLLRGAAPDKRHMEVLSYRLGLEEEVLDLQEIADLLHLGRDRVRWIQERMLNTLIYHLTLKTRGHARLIHALAQRISVSDDGDPEEVIYHFCLEYIGEPRAWMIGALLFVVLGSAQTYKDAYKKVRFFSRQEEEKRLAVFRTELKQGLQEKLMKLISEAAGDHSSGGEFLPHVKKDDSSVGMDSLNGEMSFLSAKGNVEITSRNGDERCFFTFLEMAQTVMWYQDRPLLIPYDEDGFLRRFQPTAGLLLDDGRALVCEVMPIDQMVQSRQLRRLNGAHAFCSERGMGLLVCNAQGETYASLCQREVAEEKRSRLLEAIEAEKILPWTRYELLMQEMELTQAELYALVVQEDLSFQVNPFQLSKLPDDLSFRRLMKS